MNVLFLGGTQFVGRHCVENALERGWTPTIFTRGQTNPNLFGDVEHLRGDRMGDVSALEGRRFDAVIDSSAYHPRAVHPIETGFYCFVSSISAYASFSAPGYTEDAPLAAIPDPLPDTYDPELYGGLKVACERRVADLFPSVLVVRPGLIVGPHDYSDRFTYWPARVVRGETILAPGRPERAVQLIDARDLAAWMLDAVAQGLTGTFNVTGPAETLEMRALLDACAAVANPGATFEWVTEKWLLERTVEPWSELPLWLPENEELAGLLAADCSAAIAAGLRFRPLEDTVRDTLAWDRTRDPAQPRKAGMDPAREAALLAEWRSGG